MDMFWCVALMLLVSSALNVRKSKGGDVLNREQTEEWKGWMQFMFLMYHYFSAHEVLPDRPKWCFFTAADYLARESSLSCACTVGCSLERYVPLAVLLYRSKALFSQRGHQFGIEKRSSILMLRWGFIVK